MTHGPRIFNLLFHCTPVASNDVWERNVYQLLRRIESFNGKRIIAVATKADGLPLADLSCVQRAFRGTRIDEWVTSDECDSKKRETPTFYPMMDLVRSESPDEATFYAHAKGVTKNPEPQNVTSWRNASYKYLLDDFGSIRRILSTHPCVGTFRQRNDPARLRQFKPLTPRIIDQCKWHYAGTFWWVRHDALFGNPGWRDVPMDCGYSVELYLPFLFNHDEAFCVYGDDITSPYSVQPEIILEPPDWRSFMTGPVKVELGGGIKPRGEGYVNFDLNGKPDVVFDLQTVADGTARLPFEDASVDAVYAAHVIEHITPAVRIFHEMSRICKVGAEVEIRVPHYLHSYGMNDSLDISFTGHRHTWAPRTVYLFCQSDDHEKHWPGPRKLKLVHTHYEPEIYFQEVKPIFNKLGMTDEQIFRHVPETCHEIRYRFEVVAKGQ